MGDRGDSQNGDDEHPAAPVEYRQHRFAVPPGAVDLTLIRHGESEPARPNESFPMVDGHGDPALHPAGHAQAQAVAERLGGEHFDALYVTTLRRTHQTLAPLAAQLGMTPAVEPDLREVCLGDWDGGLYRIKAAEQDPIFMASIETGEWGLIPGAETTAAVQARVGAALDRMAAVHRDQRVAACVHGGVIAAVMALATGARPFAFLGAENGSIHRLVLHETRIRVRTFNDTGHLAKA
ncbi:MAG: histidine phosphatase family protein [Pseudomonadota bacterium]